MRSAWRTVFGMELRFHLKRPLFWVLVGSLFLICWGLSTGNVTISSGDSTIGGQARAWVTSEFAVARMFPLVTFLVYSFFVAVGAGMAIPRDEELQVGPILHATPLEAKHYVWAKFGAALAAFGLVLALHLAFTIFFNQILPNGNADLIRGPFSLINYLRPALVLALPFLVFLCGVSFAVGERTRQPILVFVTPVMLFLVSIFFLWGWAPTWLDPQINRLLMWLEPSGFRWLNETWTTVDLGVEHYNLQPVVYDLPFLLSRLVFLGLGIAAVFWAQRHFVGTLRGARSSAPRARWWRRGRQAAPDARPVATIGPSLSALAMRSTRPGFWRTVLEVARFEARNLRSQPGLYIFVPLILIQSVSSGSLEVGSFSTPLLLTPGTAAVQAMNALTLLVCLLLLFYTTESISREWTVDLAPLFFTTPTRTAALLTGKAVANSIVASVILIGAYCGAAIVMLAEGEVAPSLGPFLLVWGLLLIPTFWVWSAFVVAALALTGSRFTTYGIGLGALAFTGWKQFRGEMNWVGNWNLWSTTTWTDLGGSALGGLQPNGAALGWNRLLWLGVGATLVALAVRLFPRRLADAGRRLDRLQPRRLLRAGLKLAPLALPVFALGFGLWVQIGRGFQGEQVERREEEYRGRNLLTWLDAETPRLADVRVDLELDPERHAFAVEGRYRLENRSAAPIHRMPFSVGDHFEDLAWTLNGEAAEPEDWARMHVFALEQPLAPGESIEVGFAHHGRLPRGMSKNGGGLSEFVLPAGVVLTSFNSSFLPVPFYESGRGVDEDNRLEPRSFEEGHWQGPTRPAMAGGVRYTVETRITGPADYRYHGVGRLESDTVVDGRRTMLWRTEHPVSFFNVVAGRWDEWKGDGVSLFYHPGHTYNIEEIGRALEAARKYYSEWFYPYPWEHLKISEFPALAGYAQGFPTNITFSEELGFLARSKPESQVAFMVTAHEVAHQWWANILMPGEGPGGNLLSEGMAHFSTILLIEAVLGERERIEFCRRIETQYGEGRQIDSEQPLVWIDGSKAGDTTVTYDKGGWVFWMLLQHLGRERGLEALQDFIAHYAEENEDFPVLQDFIERVRPFAPDAARYQEFVDQWFLDVVIPEYRWSDVRLRADGDGWIVEGTLHNVGEGRMPLDIAASRGERFPDDETEGEPWRQKRTRIDWGPGESVEVVIETDFEPDRLVVDPDAKVLMLKRDRAEIRLKEGG